MKYTDYIYCKNIRDNDWNESYERVCGFIKEIGYLPSRSVHEHLEERILGIWINTNKSVYKTGKLLPWRKEKLKLIGLLWTFITTKLKGK